MPSNENIGIFLPDGSEIDEDYFVTLEPQTTLIVLRPGEQLLTGIDKYIYFGKNNFLVCGLEFGEFSRSRYFVRHTEKGE